MGGAAQSGAGEFYAEVMAESPDGWRPVFEHEQMLKSREPWVFDAHWEELAQVRCPALVVRGLDGELGRAEAQEMVRVLPRGSTRRSLTRGILFITTSRMRGARRSSRSSTG